MDIKQLAEDRKICIEGLNQIHEQLKKYEKLKGDYENLKSKNQELSTQLDAIKKIVLEYPLLP